MTSCEFRIDLEGTWHYRGMEVSRRDIVTLFYRNLWRDASGQYFLGAGERRYQVDVDDTAYVVRAVSPATTGEPEAIYLLLSDDSVEALAPSTLRIGKGNVPYCRVKGAAFDARFTTSGYYQLAKYIQHDPSQDKYYVSFRGEMHYIPEI